MDSLVPGTIKRLDEKVVNRIAAGEIIQRPANAIKELIENSLDAKSTNIQVIVKSGGLKYIQIQDNGTGIRREDLEIVCERFTTSKLENFEDLTTINTYGFRGEALASISHIAHLTIQTKTKDAKCAFKASYVDGKLKGDIKTVAGNQGTQITIEDVFYNVPQRKQALKTPNDEFHKIFDVVGKYAIHNPKVGFTLKKFGEPNSIKTASGSSKIDNIRTVYNNEIAKEIFEINYSDNQYKFEMNALLTNVNYSTKKTVFLLFINHRLVDSVNIRTAIEESYALYLAKGSHPFIYLSLEMESTNIDVNVHPTKHEVHFLHEEEIIAKIKAEIEANLFGSNVSRSFYTQTRLFNPTEVVTDISLNETKSQKPVIQPKDFIRTDPKDQKLQTFFLSASQNEIKEEISSDELSSSQKSELNIIDISSQSDIAPTQTKQKKDTELTSVLKIRKSIEDDCNLKLRQLLTESSFVGVIDRKMSLIQSGTKMYLCNLEELTKIFFYQTILYNFENFDRLLFENGMSIKELVLYGLQYEISGWTEDDGPKEVFAKDLEELLIEKCQILDEYFGIRITKEGFIETLPVLVNGHTPSMAHLPLFLIKLGTDVDWETETECFKTLSKELAEYYSIIPEHLSKEEYSTQIEHLFYSSVKQYLLPPSQLIWEKIFITLANLPDLYKVFERC